MATESERDAVDRDDEQAEPTASGESEAGEGSAVATGDAASDAAASTADGDGEEAAESGPRNRAERRLVAQRERRGQPAEGSKDRNRALRSKLQETAEAAALEEEERKLKLPPRTVSGRNSADLDEVPPWAQSAVRWMSERRQALSAVAAAVVLVAGGAVAVTMRTAGRNAEAAAALSAAVQTSEGRIRAADAPADPPGSPPPRGPTFPEHAARARATLEAYRRVVAQHGSAPAAPYARLGEAFALFDLGRYAEAKPIFESLVGGALAGLEPRALEGLAFTLEALNDLPGALRRFEELGRVQDGSLRDFATFQQARILRRQNQDPRAKDLLRALLERLNRSRPEDPLGAGSAGVVYEQAQALLRDIDPVDELGRRRTPTDPSQILRMLQQAGGAGGH